MKTKNIILTILTILLTILLSYNIYKIYNEYKNTNYLSNYIIENNNNKNIFQGNIDNNYLLFNNLLWRIIKVNDDNTIMLILDDYLNVLPQDKTSKTFNTLYNNLDKKMLVKNKICLNNIENNSIIKCTIFKNENYIDLLTTYDYLNSMENNESYITKDNEKIWLNDENTIGINNKVSKIDKSNYNIIRPIITLKNNIEYQKGNGSIKNPYIVEAKKLGLGSTLSINDDKYIVIDTTNNYKLLSLKVIKDISYDEVEDYLNNFINYNNIIDKKYIPSINDIKLDNTYNDYYLQEKENNFNIAYDKEIRYIDKEKKHNIRYIIEVSKDNIGKLKYEN